MSKPKISFAGALVAALLVATACGNRHDVDAFPPVQVVNVSPGSGQVPAADAAGAIPADAGAAAVAGTTDAGTSQSAAAPSVPGATAAGGPATAAPGAAGPATSSGRSGQSAGSSGAARSAGGATSATAQPRSAAGSAGGAAAPGAPATPATPAGGCPAPCGPVVVGHVGTYSGVFSGFANGYRAVEAWAGLMNERGGVDGHPVRVVVGEDGGDPARHLALVRQIVEEQGAIAFVGCFCPTTGAGAVDYLNKKRVPVIGGNPSLHWYDKSPMHFPQASLADGYVRMWTASTAEVAVPQKKTKVGILACSEVQVCKDEANGAPKHAPDFGMKVVYSAQASLAAPDYTAECLAARNAGAEVFMLAFDPNSYPRIARSCSSVGYKPLFSLVADVTNATAQIDVMDGAFVGNPVRAWTDVAHPGIAEMHRAFKLHARNGEVDNTAGLEWVSAKVFERAIRGRLSPTPTPQDVLAGLWSIENDNIGGLTAPLTFAEGVDEKPFACWSIAVVSGKKWTSPRPDVRCE